MVIKLSIRVRFAILTAALLTICCLLLSVITGISTNKMMSHIKNYEYIKSQDVVKEDERFALLIEVDTQQKHNDQRVFWILVMIVTTGAVSSYFIAGLALKPIKALSKTMKEITEHDLHTAIKMPMVKDEIFELAASFDLMLTRLDKLFEKQKQFSANVAHELRTPLTILQAKYEVLEMKENVCIDDYKKVIDVSKHNVERLGSIVNTLLLLHTAASHLKKENVNLYDILVSIITEFNEIAKDRRITFGLQCATIVICADKELLYCALFNLVDNAVKYNNDGGKIFICAFERDDTAEISVRDTGAGIANEYLEHLFEPFYRVDKSRSRKSGGAGLGLAIVADIAKLHNGKVTVKSVVGSGSEFTLSMKKGEVVCKSLK